jgi:hypothetical protein
LGWSGSCLRRRGWAARRSVRDSEGGKRRVGPCIELTVIRPMPLLCLAALHVDRGIRGQDLRLVEHQSLLRVVRPRGYTPRVHLGFRKNCTLRTLFPCGIVRAHLASCGAVRSKQAWQEGRTGGLPSLTE